jgi:hypothetical protein|tara:strand:+ start:5162 stop:5266 length:105 start_codon:yes stop_codon:yes gene_type:complete
MVGGELEREREPDATRRDERANDGLTDDGTRRAF